MPDKRVTPWSAAIHAWYGLKSKGQDDGIEDKENGQSAIPPLLIPEIDPDGSEQS